MLAERGGTLSEMLRRPSPVRRRSPVARSDGHIVGHARLDMAREELEEERRVAAQERQVQINDVENNAVRIISIRRQRAAGLVEACGAAEEKWRSSQVPLSGSYSLYHSTADRQL